MPVFSIMVVQTFRVTREIIVAVDADDLESAIEDAAANEAPDFEDPGWRTFWEAQSEEITAGGDL